MVMFASQVSQQIYQSQLAMAQQSQHAQMLSAQMGLMPQMSAMGAMNSGQGGLYGEQIANRLAGAGRTAMGLGGLGLGLAGALTGAPLDPFSAALSAGRMGFRMGGMSGAVGLGAVAAAPFMMASAAGSVYGGAFMGGMQQQTATNSMLRNNFNFQGGQGPMGRGFSQGQMGAIGGVISSEVGRSPFTSSQELNQLVSQGAESGMFTAVRDVESFTRRFRTMLDGLRKIQKELGGTLNEALQFTRGAQQVGIFTSGGRTAFAAEMRDTMTATGMDQTQLFSLAATGSMLSRATGGVGRQGALGAIRTARHVGTAMQTGAINAELLSEATGGLQGEEAIQAFTARTLQQSDRFSRSARGRYSLFSLANEAGNGLDETALARFRSGDISVGGVMRDANKRVNKMGRARALNQEGHLRGAMMEEGGMAGQIGMMRLMVGDRALEGGDDLAQLVMQRRMGMSQQESQVWTSLMRNQSTIANAESTDKMVGKREVERAQDQRLNRSVESFVANLEHGLQDMTGVTRARELGRNFLTKVSSAAERAMNNFLGVEGQAMDMGEQRAMTRLGSGMANSGDRDRLNFMKGGGGSSTALADLYRKSTSAELLDAVGIHTTQTYGAMMDSRGVDLRKMGARERATAERDRLSASAGVVRGADLEQFRELDRGDHAATIRRMTLASMAGGREGIYKEFAGTSANAVDAFARRRGFGMPEEAFTLGTSQRSRAADLGIATGSGVLAGALAGGIAGSLGGPIGTVGGAVIGGVMGGLGFGGLEFMRSPMSDQDKALAFISRGGHAGKEANAARRRLGPVELRGEQRGDAMAGITLEQMALSKSLDKDISPDTMKAVLESDSFKTSLRRLPGLSARAAQQELTTLEMAASNMKDPEQQRAARVAIEQLRDNMKKHGGKIGSEFANAIADPKRAAEQQRMYIDMQSQYDKMGEALSGLSNKGQMGALRSAIGEVGNAIFNQDDKTYDTVKEQTRAAAQALSMMTPEELALAQEKIGGTDYGKSLLSVGIQRQGAMTNLSGGGRRGRRGAAESAFGMATGNSLGEMDLTVGGRTLNKRNQAQVLYQEFSKGGKGADELEGQLVANLKRMGVDDASENIKMLRKSIESGKGIDKDEGGKLFDKLAFDEDLQKVQAEGVKRAQEKSDPLGVERNGILKNILTAVNKNAGIVEEATGGVNMSVAP
jgi:hypothetical protein